MSNVPTQIGQLEFPSFNDYGERITTSQSGINQLLADGESSKSVTPLMALLGFPPSSTAYCRSSSAALLLKAKVSSSEARYIVQGFKEGCRNDARTQKQYRNFSVQTGCFPSASGSAKVSSPNSEVFVAVKGEIFRTTADRGELNVAVDCSPSVSPESDWKGGMESSAYISQLISKYILGPQMMDRKKLIIIPGKLAWRISVDVIILTLENGSIDAISLAIRAALLDTRLPAVTPIQNIDEETGELECDVLLDERPESGILFPAEKIPLCVTVGVIASSFVWDLSPEENACCSSRVTVSIGKNGECYGIFKSGDRSLQLSAIANIVSNSCTVGSLLHRRLEEAILGDNHGNSTFI